MGSFDIPMGGGALDQKVRFCRYQKPTVATLQRWKESGTRDRVFFARHAVALSLRPERAGVVISTIDSSWAFACAPPRRKAQVHNGLSGAGL